MRLLEAVPLADQVRIPGDRDWFDVRIWPVIMVTFGMLG
jgi:hypothetical protein